MKRMIEGNVLNTVSAVNEQSWFRVVTPRADGGAAVAMIELGGEESSVTQLGFPTMAVGEVKRCKILSLDDGLVARITEKLWLLMPHGGPLILRLAAAKLIASGCIEKNQPDSCTFPEAHTAIESHMLDALASARSPRAVSALLRQPTLWNVPHPVHDPRRDLVLNRLLVPPRVVVLGGANIGKSSLANALARRDIAIVADMPGTTRDHVGVWLDLDGLVVRWIDTPGLRDTHDEIEIAARTQALALLETASLILLCGDTTSAPPPPPPGVSVASTKVVQLRSDLGDVSWHADWKVSVRSAASVNTLASGVRETLVPQECIDLHVPWKFWT